jgi:hypothetical protein
MSSNTNSTFTNASTAKLKNTSSPRCSNLSVHTKRGHFRNQTARGAVSAACLVAGALIAFLATIRSNLELWKLAAACCSCFFHVGPFAIGPTFSSVSDCVAIFSQCYCLISSNTDRAAPKGLLRCSILPIVLGPRRPPQKLGRGCLQDSVWRGFPVKDPG